MAGAGYKLFNTGDVLTAQQVNEYLQQQTVMVFANSTARTTALSGVLAEGMMSYLQNTNSVEVYNGSAWVAVAADQTPLTTKGDLFTFTTVDARLGVGSNGQVLTANSATATGLEWATSSSGGMTLLSTTSLTGATTTVSSISSSYTNLLIISYGMTNATANGNFRIAPNGTTNITSNTFGNSYLDADYLYSHPTSRSLSLSSSVNAFSCIIYNYASTASRKPFQSFGVYNSSDTGTVTAGNVAGGINTTSAISSLTFSNSGGNFSTGTVLIYGVK